MIDGTDHIVEIDAPIKEAPGHVTHQRAQETGDIHGVRKRAAVARGPVDMGEVFVAAEAKRAELEFLVSQDIIGQGCNGFDVFCCCVHGLNPFRELLAESGWGLQAAWQISAHFSTDKSPLQVCKTTTLGCAARNW